MSDLQQEAASFQQVIEDSPLGELCIEALLGKGKGTSLVIFPSAFGITEDLKEQMQELAPFAEWIVSFDPFFPDDAGALAYYQSSRVMERLHAFNREQAVQKFLHVLRWTRAQSPSTALVALGICAGGPAALHVAAQQQVDAVITWHGTRMHEDRELWGAIRCPAVFHLGEDDPFVPPEAVQALQAAFSASPHVQFHVHPGATHGFTHRHAEDAYHREAEQLSLQSVRQQLEALSR